MEPYKLGIVILALLCGTYGYPRRSRSRKLDIEENFIGESTNELSKAILQSYVDDDSNLAFSPFGYSAIFAILAEGAKGETRDQLSTALKLPHDQDKTRTAYLTILKRLNNTNEYKVNRPEFKNWFYVYKNYTINDDYRKILEEFYLTEVRSVHRYDPSLYDVKYEKKEVPQIDPLPSIEIKDPVISEIKNDVKAEEPLKDNKEVETTENIKSKPDDKEEPKVESEKIISFAMEDKPQKVENYEEKKSAKKDKIKSSNLPPVKKNQEGGDLEIMEVAETKNRPRVAKSFHEKDGAHSLSANRVGNKESNSLMILFNGLYFRDLWKTPFYKVDDEPFYLKQSEKKSVPMMKTKGTFKMGPLPGLASNAVELPYEGGRYSLIVVKPKNRDGLRQLIEDLASFTLSELPEMLYPVEATVKMPSFYIETTTKPLGAFAKFGVSMIFNPKANLSGVSPIDGLFVQEMVQHVSVRVDESDLSGSQISAANPSEIIMERSQPLVNADRTAQEEFVVDHPFLYFVLDMLDNVVLVAGKVTNPVKADETYI